MARAAFKRKLKSGGSQIAEALDLDEQEILEQRAILEDVSIVPEGDFAVVIGKKVQFHRNEFEIGVCVNRLAHNRDISEDLRAAAREVVENWRLVRRQRQAVAVPDPSSSVSLSAGKADLKSASPPDTTAQLAVVSDAMREKVREKLVAALGCESLPGIDVNLITMSTEIEECLFSALSAPRQYLAQARSITFNLRDADNKSFRQKVLDGSVRSSELSHLSAEDMASGARSAQRTSIRRESAKASTASNSEQMRSSEFVCEQCAGNDTSYSQMMATESCIRSGGEPVMTAVTRITCISCGYAWTERSGFA